MNLMKIKIKIKIQLQCLLRLMINNFLKIIIKYGKKTEKLMSIDFDSKPVYGNDDKYIKIKIKTYKDSITTNFGNKNGSKKYQKKKSHANVYQ